MPVMPTRSQPSLASLRISAGVSSRGPWVTASTPSEPDRGERSDRPWPLAGFGVEAQDRLDPDQCAPGLGAFREEGQHRHQHHEPAEIAEIVALLGGSATVTGNAGGAVYDLDADDTDLTNLQEALEAIGFTLIATNPSVAAKTPVAGLLPTISSSTDNA